MERERQSLTVPPESTTSASPEALLVDGLLHLASREPLKKITGRYICEDCRKSVCYYCYRCYRLAPSLRGSNDQALLPSISSSSSVSNRLPLPLAILKHKRELDGKSTAVHAKLLAPDSVEILPFDPQEPTEHFPAIEGNTILLFPSPKAYPVDKIDWRQVQRLLVIDGTWQQAKAMAKVLLERTPIRCVRLRDSHETLFWRYQSIGPHCLSTIEAIYHFYRELEEAQGRSKDPRLDNLLWFFVFQYELIQEDYRRHPERHYTSRHRSDYIKDANAEA